MDRIILPSYAKVNLTLDVLGKRPDGYHDVELIMLPVSLADTITLSCAEEIRVWCDPDIGGPMESNLAYRAAKLLQATTGYRSGAAIHIHKVIPVAGGLAGGSTNAAAVLTGLNQLWGTGLTADDLAQLAIQLGSDVPFFIYGRPARVEGKGERLTPVLVRRQLWLVLATPPVAKSTGNVYRWFDALKEVRRPHTRAMEAALSAGDLPAIAAALGNVFEDVMIPRHPEIGALKALMLKEGALGALMSGAGPTVFGLVPDEETGRRLMRRLEGLVERVALVSSVGHETV
jgi:4-diphosphocytidyl-2-C-methyl-D-erythritol kinase